MQALQGEPTPEPQLIRADPPPIPDESLRPLTAVDTASLEVAPTLLEVDTARLPDDGVKRSEVFDLAADRNVKVATVCVAAMA